ncbi:MAG: NFACT family protein, partial [Traorella sp.]
MALDGLLLYKLKNELSDLVPIKINKCSQVSEHEVLFHIRTLNKNMKLMISTHSQYNRINLTSEEYQSPLNVNNFAMILRKYIEGGYITKINQVGLDRILDMEIVAYDDLSDRHTYHLFVELMGKYANIVLVENKHIIDALKRIPPFENTIRSIYPGCLFTYPKTFEKKDPFIEDTYDENESFTQQFHGFSPLLSREFTYRIKNHENFRDIMNELQNS